MNGHETPQHQALPWETVVLEGAPPDMPTRIEAAEPDGERLSVEHLNGREHFERTGESAFDGSRECAVFRWVYSTKNAE